MTKVEDLRAWIAEMEAAGAREASIADEVLPWIDFAKKLVTELGTQQDELTGIKTERDKLQDAFEAAGMDEEYGESSAWNEAHEGFLSAEEMYKEVRVRLNAMRAAVTELEEKGWGCAGKMYKCGDCPWCRVRGLLEDDR